MRGVLLSLALAADAAVAVAAPRASDDWVVQLRWQATSPVPATADQHWTTAAAAVVDGWPALRLRPGATARWRHEAWQSSDDIAAAWTTQGPALLATERRAPSVRALTLQARPARRSTQLDLHWSVVWPESGADGSSEAQGALTLSAGHWVTLAEWAAPGAGEVARPGDRRWSTDGVGRAGWRLQVRAERP